MQTRRQSRQQQNLQVPSAHILSLPDELLLFIVQYVDYCGSNTILDLAVVHRKFTPIVRMVITKWTCISIYDFPDTQAPKHLLQYLKFLKKYPELVHCVHWADFSWNKKRMTTTFPRIIETLARSQSLHRISVTLHRATQFDDLPALFDAHGGAFPNLKWVDIGVDEHQLLPADYVARFCEIPTLERLSNDLSIVTECSIPEMLNNPQEHFKTQGLNLRHFKSAGPTTHIDLLKLILPRAKALTVLDITLPNPGVWNEYGTREENESTILLGSFSPKAVQDCLQHVANTLEQLAIVTMKHGRYNWEYVYIKPLRHDGTFLNMSSFTKIRNLQISACLIFENPESMAELGKNHVADLLPPNVERLIIYFEGLFGLFCDLEEMADEFAAFGSKFWMNEFAEFYHDPGRIAWLFGIVEYIREGKLPYLSEITLEECWTQAWGRFEQIDVLELWPQLCHGEEDVEIAVLIMVMTEFVEECISFLRSYGFTGGIDTFRDDLIKMSLGTPRQIDVIDS